MESGKAKKKIVRIEDCRTQEEVDKITEEEVKETALDRSGSDSLDEDNYATRTVTWNQDAIETKNLLSIWDLVSQEKETFESWKRQHKRSPAALGLTSVKHTCEIHH